MQSGGPAGLCIPVTRSHRLVLLGVIVAAAACSPARDEPATARIAQDTIRADSTARARQDSINRTLPGYVVDSILPVEEELRRFRIALGNQSASGANGADSLTALIKGSDSREALVRRFIKALVTNDSSDLRAMRLSAREFADFVYPESPYTRPPYRQSPALVWNQIRNPSTSGLTRLLRRLGGHPLRYVDHSCARRPERQGGNMIWTDCTVRLLDSSGEKTRHRLFGSVIERDRRFKFVSYSNDF